MMPWTREQTPEEGEVVGIHVYLDVEPALFLEQIEFVASKQEQSQ